MIEMNEQEINEKEEKEEEVKGEEEKEEESVDLQTIQIDKNQNKLIIFAKLNNYYLILFISPVFCMLTNYFLIKIEGLSILENSYCFPMLSVELFYIFDGLFYFIVYFRKNSNKGKELAENLNTNKDIQYIYNEKIFFNSNKYIIFAIILSSLVIAERFISSYIFHNKMFNTRFYFIILIPLFSKLILKENLYKHQYLSLAISIIGWIIINIPVCLKMEKDDILANFLNLIKGATYPLSLVMIKYLSDKYYITPLKTSLIFGIISVILTLLGFIIYSLSKYNMNIS